MTETQARTVVVTGASTGIGEACALRLAELGWRTFAGVRRLEDGAALERQAPERLTALRLDVTDPDSIRAAGEAVSQAVGGTGLDGLVNNAGISVASPLEVIPLERLRHQLEVNVVGQVAVSQAFLPLLRKARGRVVIMGSIFGRMPLPFAGAYSASKAALAAIADALRVELRPWGLHVALVEPGSIVTPLWARSIAAADELRREATPEAHRLYGEAVLAAREAAREMGERGIAAARVAEVVVHALSARWPRTRYLVGTDARVMTFLTWLPDRLRDAVLDRAMGLHRLRLPGAASTDPPGKGGPPPPAPGRAPAPSSGGRR